jgi:hypothetical protein
MIRNLRFTSIFFVIGLEWIRVIRLLIWFKLIIFIRSVNIEWFSLIRVSLIRVSLIRVLLILILPRIHSLVLMPSFIQKICIISLKVEVDCFLI